ncbi:MAG: OsmC family protein [Kiritimatiellaeota bacterium]|nr:OsmC family protein [Kiritimatiellota bacterium]
MSVKKVKIEVIQGSGFKTECRAGKHRVIIDQPANAGGTDEGPTPLDVQLMALGGCIASIGRIVAMQRHLNVRGFKIVLEGELDTDGLLGKPSDKRVGLNAITARVKIDTDLGRAEQQKLLAEIEKRCPISDNLKNITPVEVELVG